MTTLRALDFPAVIIGQPYTSALLDRYDWTDAYPVVELHSNRTVGTVVDIADANEPSVDLTGVTIVEGRVVSAGGDFDNDALASREELRAAGFNVGTSDDR